MQTADQSHNVSFLFVFFFCQKHLNKICFAMALPFNFFYLFYFRRVFRQLFPLFSRNLIFFFFLNVIVCYVCSNSCHTAFSMKIFTKYNQLKLIVCVKCCFLSRPAQCSAETMPSIQCFFFHCESLTRLLSCYNDCEHVQSLPGISSSPFSLELH